MGVPSMQLLAAQTAAAGTPPAIAATTTTDSTSVLASHTVALPSGVTAGDVLVIAIQSQGTSTYTFPTGWEIVATSTGGAVAWIVATTEGASVSVGVAVSNRIAAVSLRITNATDVEGAVHASLDPPTLSPSWGSTDLWLSTLCFRGSGSNTVTVPSTFGGQVTVLSTTGSTRPSVSVASLESTSTTINPATWGLTPEGADYGAATIAIRG